MGIYRTGPFGAFIGRVGNLVSSMWKDKSVMKIRPRISNRPPTITQQSQRIKFQLVSDFLNAMASLFDETFDKYTQAMSARNYGMQQVMEAVQGDYPDFFLDYSKVPISKGTLQNPDSPTILSTQPGTVTFKWTDNTGFGGALADDKSVLVVYCEELKGSISTLSGPSRSAGTADIKSASLSGKEVHAWIAVYRPSNFKFSNSIYIGKVIVA